MLVRCSSLGKIMTNARSKKEVLSKTAKSYVKQTLLEDEFGIKKRILVKVHRQRKRSRTTEY